MLNFGSVVIIFHAGVHMRCIQIVDKGLAFT